MPVNHAAADPNPPTAPVCVIQSGTHSRCSLSSWSFVHASPPSGEASACSSACVWQGRADPTKGGADASSLASEYSLCL